MLYQFGSGNVFGLVSSGGVNVPRKFGALQDVSVDISFNLKELYGQNQFPLAVARGQGKIDGKAKFANLNGAMLNDLFFGQTNAVGQTLNVIGEAATVPTTPFQVTVANGATFKEDLGVTYAATGVPLTRVPSAPVTGQYSVVNATGVYTFAAADVGLGMLFDYAYTASASGNTTTINNLLSGSAPTFIVSIPLKYNAKWMYLRLNACVSSKLTLATKIEDFLVPEFDFKAFADAAGIIGTLSLTE
jgi:hypothetical protein